MDQVFPEALWKQPEAWIPVEGVTAYHVMGVEGGLPAVGGFKYPTVSLVIPMVGGAGFRGGEDLELAGVNRERNIVLKFVLT
ncbi:MAG: hypothetical protein GY737_01240 [Desulfobacteraceae bacterium]|nr:hypothetical protein [Desulfobacteraceae bacterium]